MKNALIFFKKSNVLLMIFLFFVVSTSHAENNNWLSLHYTSSEVDVTAETDSFNKTITNDDSGLYDLTYGRVLSPAWALTLGISKFADLKGESNMSDDNISDITDVVYESIGFITSGSGKKNKLYGDAIRVGLNYSLPQLRDNANWDVVLMSGVVMSFHKLEVSGLGRVLNKNNDDFQPGVNAILPSEELITATEKFTNANLFYGASISYTRSLIASSELRLELRYLLEDIDLELESRVIENQYEHLSFGVGITF